MTGQGTLQEIPGAKERKEKKRQCRMIRPRHPAEQSSRRQAFGRDMRRKDTHLKMLAASSRTIMLKNVENTWKHMHFFPIESHLGIQERHHARDMWQEMQADQVQRHLAKAFSMQGPRRFKKNESRPSANTQRYLAGDNWEGNSPGDKRKEMKIDPLLNDSARASSIKHKSNHRQLLAKPLIFFSPTNTWKDADPESTSVQTSVSNVQRETFMV